MRHIAMLCSLLLLSSCISGFQGYFETEEEVTLIHSTVFGNERERVIPAGSFKTEFRFQPVSDKIRLKVQTNEGSERIKLDIPKNTHVPRNGNFLLRSEETGQNYDIEGTVETTTNRSRTYHRTETCSQTFYRTVCHNRCYTDSNGTPRCRTHCTNQPYQVYGHKDVSYHYLGTQKKIELNFLSLEEGGSVAEFSGYDSDSRIVYEYRGQCRIHGHPRGPRGPYPRY